MVIKRLALQLTHQVQQLILSTLSVYDAPGILRVNQVHDREHEYGIRLCFSPQRDSIISFFFPPPQQRHKHIHTGQRNFVCPICAKRFREAGELQRHQRVHTGEKPYQCQLCHTRFAERNTLRRHTKRKHPYHQVAMEMLSERSGGNRGSAGGGSGVQEEEESAEWYNSTVSNFDNSESEAET